MPSFFIAGTSSTSTATPSFFSAAGPARELLRVEHVGRLVDQIARHDHAVGDRLAHGPGLLRRARVADADRDLRFGRRRPRPPCAWSCSGRTRRRAAACQAQVPPLGRASSRRRKFGEDRGLVRRGRHLAARRAAELDEILGLELVGLAGAQNHQARHREAGRRNDLERATVLAGEAVGRGRPLEPGRRLGPSALRLAGPNFSPSSQNRMRTPAVGAANEAKAGLRASGIGNSLAILTRLTCPYGLASAVCKARPKRGLAAPPQGPRQAPHRVLEAIRSINRLLCMFNGFAIPKPLCATDQGY